VTWRRTRDAAGDRPDVEVVDADEAAEVAELVAAVTDGVEVDAGPRTAPPRAQDPGARAEVTAATSERRLEERTP
jgi:hypothetical protein